MPWGPYSSTQQTYCWQAAALPPPPPQQQQQQQPGDGSGNVTKPLLQLNSALRPAGQTSEFIRFSEAGSEVGGLYHSEHGLQLRSAAGDFAEWHPALDPSELPFEEGSVVGLFGGQISLRTGKNSASFVPFYT